MVSTRTASSSTTRILRATLASCCLTKAPTNIIFCLFLSRALKNLGCWSILNKLTTQEETSEMRDAGSLLHIMRHDNNSIILYQLSDQLLNFESSNRVQ